MNDDVTEDATAAAAFLAALLKEGTPVASALTLTATYLQTRMVMRQCPTTPKMPWE